MNECHSIHELSNELSIDRGNLQAKLKQLGFTLPNRLGSSIEYEVIGIIESFGLKVIHGSRECLPPTKLEIDIFVPELGIAFEMNGLYWHSGGQRPIAKEYHRTKFELAASNNIKLFQIPSDITGAKLKNFIVSKIRRQDKVSARSCELFIPSIKEYGEFLQEHHFQGSTNSSIRYGLKLNGTIVGVIGFVKSGSEFNLNRMCFGSVSVTGGAMKLLTAFLRQYPDSDITTYSSNDYSDGGLYTRLGFSKETESTTDMWYVDKRKTCRLNRRLFQKKTLINKLQIFDDKLTEVQNMINNGYSVYYGSGTIKWTLNR
jgi:hypothetical protein